MRKGKRPPTPAQGQLAERRFLRRWWWFDLAHKAKKCEPALAWEMIRRIRAYRALWRKSRNRTISPYLLSSLREALGRPYVDLMINGFDPDLTWLELEERQRLTAGGYLIGADEALKANEEWSLLGQGAEKPHVNVGIVQLRRNDSGHLKLIRDRSIAYEVGNIEDTEFFRDLPLDAPSQCVCVIFDIRGARDALLESFAVAMQQWLGTKPPALGKEMDAKYWAKVARENKQLAILWNQDGTANESWKWANSEVNVRVDESEQSLIPFADPPLAVFMVSGRHNLATVRAAFHTQLKAKKNWLPRCVAFWKTRTLESKEPPRNPDGSKRIEIDEKGFPLLEKVARPVFDKKKDLLSFGNLKRRARRRNEWLGLATNDVVRDGLPLGKRTAEGEFLLRQPATTCDTLYNAQRSTEKWLKELDDAAGRLDKQLAYRID